MNEITEETIEEIVARYDTDRQADIRGALYTLLDKQTERQGETEESDEGDEPPTPPEPAPR